MSIKAVLFDKDGTLIDFGDTFFDASIQVVNQLSNGSEELKNRLAEAVGLNLDTGYCPADSEIVGGTALTIARLWQPILDHPSAEELSLSLDQYFDAYTEEAVSIFEFTRPTLSALESQNVIMGVATNDSEANAHSHLGAIDIHHYFSFIAGYDSGFGSKPEGGMIEAFSKSHNFAPQEIVMVGDSINDLKAGRNGGAISVAVTSGLAQAEELSPFADHILSDISRLPELIRSI